MDYRRGWDALKPGFPHIRHLRDVLISLILGHCAGIVNNSGQETALLSFHPQGNLIQGKMDHLGQGCLFAVLPRQDPPFQSTNLLFSLLPSPNFIL